MVLIGHIKNGAITLDNPISLPEGAAVEVHVMSAPPAPRVVADEGSSLLERLRPIVGQVEDLPADASLNIDHYLYGHPKR
jgi:hypothetical protein